MHETIVPPSFEAFSRWLAQREALVGTAPPPDRCALLLDAARVAREETLRAVAESSACAAHVSGRQLEALQLLAAASSENSAARPPELTTARGFRVTLAYDDGPDASTSTICVLVRCPVALVDRLLGKLVYLWHGSERFELGQFDAEGKAIGMLPAGIEIALSDFTKGRIKLEEPSTEDD